MSRSERVAESPPRRDESVTSSIFLWSVAVGVITGLTVSLVSNPGVLAHPELLFWIAGLSVVQLLPVPVSGKLQLSFGFPILLGVAILYAPLAAAFVAFIGSFDPLEVRRKLAPRKSLFNRSQIALSTLAGSAAFHSLGSINSNLGRLLASALCAVAANYSVNVFFVTIAMRVVHGFSLSEALRQLRLGGPAKFLLNYVGLASVGIIIARLYSVPDVRFLGVAALILPLVFGRQMFFRTMALEAAHKELKDRQRVLKALSNRMAEERQDERMRIAAYLHDDLAQMLFRLNLQAQMAKKRLTQGDTTAVGKDLDGILQTKQETSDAIRALIRDLHRSPIGRRGLAEAIQSFADDMSRGATTQITVDVVEVSLPPPIQLLIYQIAREAAMNALKHADAREIRISLAETGEGVALTITDDGKGFDTSAPPPEGHFGSVMMKERALVAGGSYAIQSEVGKGTSITASFPRVWVEEGSELETASVGQTLDAGKRPASGPPIGTAVGPPPRSARAGDANGQGATARALDPLAADEQAPLSPSKAALDSNPATEEQPATPDPRVVPA
jgi:signal transduction histidine kinase